MNLQGIGMTSQRTRNRLAEKLEEMGIRAHQILNTIRLVPRHVFVDEALASRAYENTALPIGHNQTISQPYIVARMTEALYESGPLDRVLEVGTGCGYQTAVLSHLVKEVYSIERIDALHARAKNTLNLLNIRNVRLKHGDGTRGWDIYAPFDAIIVTAAPLGVPEKLLQQLTIGGRLVIPVGESGQQKLLLIERTEDGFSEKTLDVVSFVPMIDGVA